MAYETNVGLDVSFPANADFSSAGQYYFVTLLSTGKIALAAGAAGEAFVGVLQGDPKANQAGGVRYGGISKVHCGGSFNAGDAVTSDGSGKAVKYTKATVFTGTPYVVSGSQIYGRALQAGALDQLAAIIVYNGHLGT